MSLPCGVDLVCKAHWNGDLDTTAEVAVDLAKGGLTGIELNLTASAIEGLPRADFQHHANTAKQNCLLSKALTGVPITLNVHYPEVQAGAASKGSLDHPAYSKPGRQ